MIFCLSDKQKDDWSHWGWLTCKGDEYLNLQLTIISGHKMIVRWPKTKFFYLHMTYRSLHLRIYHIRPHLMSLNLLHGLLSQLKKKMHIEINIIPLKNFYFIVMVLSYQFIINIIISS